MLQYGVVIILFGVTGAGKTTVGQLLSAELGWKFFDADDFHAPDNVEKMRRGVPLTDQDRRPWLERLRKLIAAWLKQKENAVLACSALKKAYRDALEIDNDAVQLIYLRAAYPLIEERLKNRAGHFMNPALLQSQFDLLEEPAGRALLIGAEQAPAEIVRTIRNALKI